MRIEVLFYLFAWIFCLLPKFKYRKNVIAVSMLVASALCIVMPPFPDWSPNTVGKFNQFFPFLMVGMSLAYLEAKECSLIAFSVIAALGISQMQGGTIAFVPFFAFMIAWIYREKIPTNKYVLSLSSLTYCFYLFHFWLYDMFLNLYKTSQHDTFFNRFGAVVSLVACCYMAHFLVEKPFIRLGKRVSNFIEKSNFSPAILRYRFVAAPQSPKQD